MPQEGNMFQNNKNKSFIIPDKAFFLLLLLFFSTPIFALPKDSEEPLHIEADSTLFNYKTGIDTYEGNVKVDQGTTHLVADRLITEKNEQHKIISAIAYGLETLAEFTTTPAENDLVLHAKAKVIKYYPLTSIVHLEENVFVTQGKNNFHGPLVIYNMKDQLVAAPASKNGRAIIVIEQNKQKS